jgi:hypothetical protein
MTPGLEYIISEFEFMHYFPDATLDNPQCKLVLRIFTIDMDSIPDRVHVLDVKLKCVSSTKNNFKTMSLEEFSVKYLLIHPKLTEEELHLIVFFYLPLGICFLTLSVLKAKQRNRPEVERDLRCTLSSFQNFECVEKEQYFPSRYTQLK